MSEPGLHDADWLIAAKQRPAAAQDWHIKRRSALARLDGVLSRRLAVVHAPAGYGKSTLLAQWRDSLQQKGLATVWLSLDEDDRAPGQLLAYLVNALTASGIAMERLAELTRQGLSTTPDKTVAAMLVNQLHQAARPVVIILDEYDRVQSPPIDAILRFLLSRLPATTHLVIASRERLPFTLADYMARDDLVSLTIQDLRFAATEARAFLPASLDDQEAAVLVARTEGWPLALQMARLWLAEDSSRVHLIRDFSGRTSDIADYLVEQIFLGLAPAIRSFLMETSLLERLNGDLANAMCGRTDSWGVIEELVRRNLFLLPLDTEGRWFRYHQLFAEFLNERLRRHDSARIAALHHAAADWFERHGHLNSAVRHALAAGEDGLAAAIMERAGGWKVLITPYAGALRRTLASVPADIVQRHPRLYLGQIFMLAKAGEVVEARRKFEALAPSIQQGVASDPPLEVEFKMVDLLLYGYEDRQVEPGYLARIENLVSPEPPLDRLVLSIFNNTLCFLHLDQRAFAKAEGEGRRAIDHLRAAHMDYAIHYLYQHMGQCRLALGRPDEAEAFYRHTLPEAAPPREEMTDIRAIAAVFLAETRLEGNQPEAAQALLDVALPHIESFDGWFDVYAAAYATAAGIAFLHHGIGRALDVLAHAEEIAHRQHLPRLSLFAAAHRVRLLVMAGRLPAAQSAAAPVLEAWERGESRLQTWRLADTIPLSLARLALAHGEPPRALDYLAALIDEAAARGWTDQLIRAQALAALAHQAQDAPGPALVTLSAALNAAAGHGYARVFLEQGEAGAALLHRCLTTSGDLGAAGADLARRLLGKTHSGKPGKKTSPLLTAREHEVLGLIGAGLSSKEIAGELALSENTVKYHRKNIYRKLGVVNRSRAIAAARQLEENPPV
jgi:LuxR family maltose regulon positive regulatory protein